MDNSKQVIHLAKQSALHKFSALAQRMAQDADNNLVQALSKNAAAMDYRTLSAARQFLREEGNALLSRLEALFREQMERAMRTMYTDLRSGLGNFSAETMTLIDDEAVNRQIEVGHLVDQLRDSCDENLGRLNIMIAQLHGKSEVRERENPFRPYIIARTLHDVLRKLVKEEETAAVLFEYLASALAKFLPEYYAELCEVFDASGVKAHLVVQPGTLKRHQREQLARQAMAAQGRVGGGFSGGGGAPGMPHALPADFDQKVLPSLQRLLKLMQQQSAAGGGELVAGNASADQISDQTSDSQAEAFQQFVSNIFSQSLGSEVAARQMPTQPAHAGYPSVPESSASQSMQAPVSAELLAKLNEFQQLAARGRGVNEQIAPLQNQLFAVREQIDAQAATQPEKLAMDVVAVLFEFILDDEQIPEGLRAQIGRLQIPLLKAAMLDPGLLQQEEHPARRLLNRMGSVAVGSAPDSEMGQSVAAEIKRIVRKILDEFDKDMAIFSTCSEELDHFMADKLRHADADTSLSVDAMEEAEKIAALTRDTITSLRESLLPLQVDKRVVQFIVEVWSRVLVRALLQDEKRKGGDACNANPADAEDSAYQRYHNILPELVWSTQEKQTPQDRAALMRLLPPLVKSLNAGLAILNMSAEESKATLDQLVAVHTQVLRNVESAAQVNLPGLDALKEIFSGMVVREEEAPSRAVAPPQVEARVIEASLAERGISVSLDIKPGSAFSSRLDTSLLSEMQVGTCVECRVDGEYKPGRLIWIGKNQSLFMFKLDINSKPMVYSSESLLKALQEGALNFVEIAPTFERAVDSLLQGAEAVQKRRS